ncbi:MAG: HD domain-containing protein [Gemmatimonadales bacterium]
MILRAAAFAAQRHQDQRRKGKSDRPYIGHTLEVAELIATVGGVENVHVLAAAILHDTVEDTATTSAEIGRRFGPKIQKLVAEVTDPPGLKGQKRRDWQVEHVRRISRGAKLIKLADRISNVGEIMTDPPRHWDLERRKRYYQWSTRVVGAIGRVNPPLEDLLAKTLRRAMAALAREDAKD